VVLGRRGVRERQKKAWCKGGKKTSSPVCKTSAREENDA